MVDATVVATQQTSRHIARSVIHRALRTLTNTEVPEKRGAWTAWLRNRRIRD